MPQVTSKEQDFQLVKGKRAKRKRANEDLGVLKTEKNRIESLYWKWVERVPRSPRRASDLRLLKG